MGDQHQHRRVQRVIEAGHLLVGTVDGQRILNQVVGADRQEIEAAQKETDGERRCRHFDHAADLDLFIENDLLAAQAGLGLLERSQGLVDFVGVGEHRDQQLDRPPLGGAQDGAQLGLEHARLGQRQADGAAPERRVGLDAFGGHAIRMNILVVAEIEGANGHRASTHALDHFLVGLVLLALVRHVAAVEEEEFGTEQADAFGTGCERSRHITRQFDIGEQLDRNRVNRLRFCRLQTL